MIGAVPSFGFTCISPESGESPNGQWVPRTLPVLSPPPWALRGAGCSCWHTVTEGTFRNLLGLAEQL